MNNAHDINGTGNSTSNSRNAISIEGEIQVLGQWNRLLEEEINKLRELNSQYARKLAEKLGHGSTEQETKLREAEKRTSQLQYQIDELEKTAKENDRKIAEAGKKTADDEAKRKKRKRSDLSEQEKEIKKTKTMIQKMRQNINGISERLNAMLQVCAKELEQESKIEEIVKELKKFIETPINTDNKQDERKKEIAVRELQTLNQYLNQITREDHDIYKALRGLNYKIRQEVQLDEKLFNEFKNLSSELDNNTSEILKTLKSEIAELNSSLGMWQRALQTDETNTENTLNPSIRAMHKLSDDIFKIIASKNEDEEKYQESKNEDEEKYQELIAKLKEVVKSDDYVVKLIEKELRDMQDFKSSMEPIKDIIEKCNRAFEAIESNYQNQSIQN